MNPEARLGLGIACKLQAQLLTGVDTGLCRGVVQGLLRGILGV